MVMARLTASTGSWKSDHRTKHDPNETNGFNSRQLMKGVQSVEHRRLSTRGLAVRSLDTTPLLDARDERPACTDSRLQYVRSAGAEVRRGLLCIQQMRLENAINSLTIDTRL